MNTIKAKLGVGPMSSEAIEAVFRYSHYHRRQLMLIPSKNQIDYNGGYVNNWTTKQFMDSVRKMRSLYPQAEVKICRDHCGPGFNGVHNLNDVYQTINADLENGFDLIHIDFCHLNKNSEEQLGESKKAIEHCLKTNPKILLEVGTDENIGVSYNLPNLSEIEREINFFQSFCQPEFYVIQTGSLIREINQVGSFNKQFVEKVATLLSDKRLKLKEHNADYLNKEALTERKGLVGAVNVAPQLGAIQTQLVLNKCLVYGVDFSEWAQEVLAGERWQKWLHQNSPENKFLCLVIAGHYHFNSPAYKRIIEQLEKYEDIHEVIINQIMSLIDHYEQSLS